MKVFDWGNIPCIRVNTLKIYTHPKLHCITWQTNLFCWQFSAKLNAWKVKVSEAKPNGGCLYLRRREEEKKNQWRNWFWKESFAMLNDGENNKRPQQKQERSAKSKSNTKDIGRIKASIIILLGEPAVTLIAYQRTTQTSI